MIADLRAAGWGVAGLAVSGAALGLLAAALTPHVAMVVVRDSSQGYPHALFLQAAEEDRAGFGGDGVLLAVLGGAGLLLGLGGGLLGRRRPAATVAGLLVGGCLAGLVAMAVHHEVLATAQVPLISGGRTYQLRPYARGPVDFAVLPFVALVVWFACQLPWLLRGGDDERPATPVSWATAGSASGPEQAPPPPS